MYTTYMGCVCKHIEFEPISHVNDVRQEEEPRTTFPSSSLQVVKKRQCNLENLLNWKANHDDTGQTNPMEDASALFGSWSSVFGSDVYSTYVSRCDMRKRVE
jgi:hypothetical protein